MKHSSINGGSHKSEAELTDIDKANLKIRQLESQIKDQKLLEKFVNKCWEFQRRGVNRQHQLAYQVIKEVSQGNHGN